MPQSNFLHEALRKTVNNKDFFYKCYQSLKYFFLEVKVLALNREKLV